MKISDMKGNATAEGYQKAIVLHSTNFSIQRNLNTKIGQVNDRESSIPKLSEVTVTKSTDSASNDLLQSLLNGANIPEVKIDICTADSTPQAYLKYTLNDVMVAEHTQGTVADSKPLEKVRLNFAKIQVTYAGRDIANKALPPHTTGFDLEKAKVL